MTNNYGLASLDGCLGETWGKMEPLVQDRYSQVGFKTLNNERMVDGMDNTGMKVFENLQFGQVRAVEKDGEPWFVAADVCRVLELDQVSRAMDRLDPEDGGLLKITHPQSLEKTIEVNGVNESGLYDLVMCSSKPEAKQFKRWITHEVIPSIRKYGAFITPSVLEDAFLNPQALIRLANVMQDERNKRAIAEQQLNAAKLHLLEAQPKIQFAEQVQEMEGALSMESFAKVMQKRGIRMGRNKLFAWLRTQGYLMKNNQPYQRYADLYFKSGFVIKSNRFVPYTQITGKGMVHVTKKILEERNVALEDVKGYIRDINMEIAAVGSVA